MVYKYRNSTKYTIIVPFSGGLVSLAPGEEIVVSDPIAELNEFLVYDPPVKIKVEKKNGS